MINETEVARLEEENRQLKERVAELEQRQTELEGEKTRQASDIMRLRRMLMGGGLASMSTKLQDALRE